MPPKPTCKVVKREGQRGARIDVTASLVSRGLSTVHNLSDVFTKTLKEVDLNRLLPGLTGYGPLPEIPDKPPD